MRGLRWRARAGVLIPGLIPVGLMILWAEHDGGYDQDTWYWGALVLLAVLAAVVAQRGLSRMRVSRLGAVALGLLTVYVGWSYLSMLWAQSPGLALDGSNRALLYLVLFALMLAVRWTPRTALLALAVFAAGIGAIALDILLRLSAADQVAQIIVDGRLEATTGYFNSNAALFWMGALVAIALASRRELPAVARGLLLGVATAGLQLSLLAQSRGWLFTLPMVLIVVCALMPDRLRFGIAAVLPVLGLLIPLHRLLTVFDATQPAALVHTGQSAGRICLIICTVVVVLGTLAAWTEQLIRWPRLSPARRRQVGVAAAVLVIAGGVAGLSAATHGDPVGFAKRQWQGFSHPTTVYSTGSHFATVGSGRYDFWRVAFNAFLAHPIGGLGQDNFGDYYLLHRHTAEEPAWTHSLELRLLVHTGLVGFLVFALFLGTAVAVALQVRRRQDPLAAAVAAIALLPLTVWLIHGSVDWFWELPALTGPALGFLAMAVSLGRSAAAGGAPTTGELTARAAATPSLQLSDRRWTEARLPASPLRVLQVSVLTAGFIAALVVLAFSYLSVREVSTADNVQARHPAAALHDFAVAHKLNPLNPVPGRLAGGVALTHGDPGVAAARFRQSISAEPGGWFAWFGLGLAESALGRQDAARRDLQHAYAIDSQQAAVRQALAGVKSHHPLTPGQAFKLLSET